MAIYDDHEWEQRNDNLWVFGSKVRGVVRELVASVELKEDGFHWQVYTYDEPGKGRDNFLEDALASAELSLGILDEYSMTGDATHGLAAPP